ncbi:MAG: hypothetical protein R3B95_11435 [Nitrospirales bacterium]|nr:hypothetical protein [Nitrospirales bacterium]
MPDISRRSFLGLFAKAIAVGVFAPKVALGTIDRVKPEAAPVIQAHRPTRRAAYTPTPPTTPKGINRLLRQTGVVVIERPNGRRIPLYPFALSIEHHVDWVDVSTVGGRVHRVPTGKEVTVSMQAAIGNLDANDLSRCIEDQWVVLHVSMADVSFSTRCMILSAMLGASFDQMEVKMEFMFLDDIRVIGKRI